MVRPDEFRSPFKSTKTRKALELPEWETLAQPARAYGKPDRVPDVPRAFLQRMSKASIEGTGLKSFHRPDWIARIAKAEGSPEQALDALAERAIEDPSEETLRGAQMILNDLGRLPDGGKLLRRKLSQKIVAELTREGR